MRNLFPEYNKKIDEEYKKIWKNAIIYLDTSFLLDLYRISESSKNEFLDLLENLKDQLWLPYQVAKEYNRNKDSVISQQIGALTSTIKKIKDLEQDLITSLSAYKEYALRGPIKETINKSFEQIIDEIEKIKKPYTDLKKNDTIFEKLCELLEGRISPIHNEKWLEEITNKGKKRYEEGIPPGYMDINKDKEKHKLFDKYRIYGDLIVWEEIIERTQKEKKPAIFITGDIKEDWIWEVAGEKKGARPELINELKQRAKQDFLLYTTDRFYRYGRERIGKEVNEETIEEIKESQKVSKVSDFTDLISHLNNIRLIKSKAREIQEIDSKIEKLEEEIRDHSQYKVPLYSSIQRMHIQNIRNKKEIELELEDLKRKRRILSALINNWERGKDILHSNVKGMDDNEDE